MPSPDRIVCDRCQSDIPRHGLCVDCIEEERMEREDEQDETVIGYECLGCGHTQATNGWGGRCDKCDGLSLEPIYF